MAAGLASDCARLLYECCGCTLMVGNSGSYTMAFVLARDRNLGRPTGELADIQTEVYNGRRYLVQPDSKKMQHLKYTAFPYNFRAVSCHLSASEVVLLAAAVRSGASACPRPSLSSDAATYNPPSSPEPEPEPKATLKKRKADDTTAATDASKPFLKQGKTRSKPKLRRPGKIRQYWGKKEEQWEASSVEDQRRFSQIRRIEEIKELSDTMSPPCTCYAGLQDALCDIYHYDARRRYYSGFSQFLCRFNNKSCSSVAANKSKSKGRTSAKATLEQRLEEIKQDVLRYKAKFGDLSDNDNDDDGLTAIPTNNDDYVAGRQC